MADLKNITNYKRKTGNYRVVITNEDSYEEVVQFKLTKLWAYAIACTLFIFGLLTVTAIIIFTPLKFYLPNSGYGNASQIKELRALKFRTDSIENELRQNQAYMASIKTVLTGNVPLYKDTTSITVKNKEDEKQKKGGKKKRKK